MTHYCGFSMNPEDYSGKYLVHYTMPDGKEKSVLEIASEVPDRLKKLRWANLTVTAVKKQKET